MPQFIIFSFYSVLKNIYLILRKKKQKYLNDNKKGTPRYTFREKYLISMRPITEEIVFLVRII